MGYSGAWGNKIHDKKPEAKISWHCTFNVHILCLIRMNDNICQLRLDFDSFQIDGPVTTVLLHFYLPLHNPTENLSSPNLFQGHKCSELKFNRLHHRYYIILRVIWFLSLLFRREKNREEMLQNVSYSWTALVSPKRWNSFATPWLKHLIVDFFLEINTKKGWRFFEVGRYFFTYES